MAMLQTYRASQPSFDEDRGQAFDLPRIFGIIRRRIFYFAIPFVCLLITGALVVMIQRPIYRAEGKILVESPEIPTDLVAPTVTAAATERIQVIQQRLMSRDNLVPIMNKFALFPSQRKWMSGTELLDLMRARADITLLDIDSLISPKDGKPSPIRASNKSSAVAFTVSFEYENPELAMKVANEFLTSILSEDVKARTNQAAETTQFLNQEVKRLQDKLDAIDAQIAQLKPTADPTKGSAVADTEQLKMQTDELTKLKADLVQASSVYSEEHPTVRALKRRIAGLQQVIAKTANAPPSEADKNTYAIVQQRTSVAKELDEANAKLTAARLGESMERNQQSERLQVIDQPIVPQKPVKPNRLKLFAFAFGLAGAIGFACLVLAEKLDNSIRSSRELVGVIDSQLVIALPYITTAGEIARRKRRMILIWSGLVIFLFIGLAAALYIGIEIDFSWLDRSWIDALTRLTK